MTGSALPISGIARGTDSQRTLSCRVRQKRMARRSFRRSGLANGRAALDLIAIAV
jgi:hypothetical protein